MSKDKHNRVALTRTTRITLIRNLDIFPESAWVEMCKNLYAPDNNVRRTVEFNDCSGGPSRTTFEKLPSNFIA